MIKVNVKGHVRHLWSHVVFLATSWDVHCCPQLDRRLLEGKEVKWQVRHDWNDLHNTTQHSDIWVALGSGTDGRDQRHHWHQTALNFYSSITEEQFQYWKKCAILCVWLFAIPWTVARQTPLSMGFSRPEYWSGLPLPTPEDLPSPGIKLVAPALAGVPYR